MNYTYVSIEGVGYLRVDFKHNGHTRSYIFQGAGMDQEELSKANEQEIKDWHEDILNGQL